jgi:hypothetical protein
LRLALLARSVFGRAGFAAAASAPLPRARGAAGEAGRVAELSRGSVGTLAARARALSRRRRMVVVSLPGSRAGCAQLSALARERGPGELLLVIQLPETPRTDTFGEPPRRYLRQLAFAIGDGLSGSPTSACAWRNRECLHGALPHLGWTAAFIDGLAAGVTGALTNDSGPVLFINAVLALAALTAYLLGRPPDEAHDGGRHGGRRLQ